MALRVNRESSRTPKHEGFAYQVEAVEAIKGLEYAAIFHEQGLGKTKIAIDLALLWLREKVVDSVLFVTKKTLVANWKEEILAHSFITPRLLGQDRQANFFAFNSPARFFLTHYEVCISELKRLSLFLQTRKVAVICDEAQKFKNPDSSIAVALFELAPQFARRVILTGTPIANRPHDIWSLIYFLDAGKALGSHFVSFKRGLDLTNKLSNDDGQRRTFEGNLTALYARLRPFSVRETKASAGIDLPTKTIVNLPVDAEDRQAELYRSYRDELRAIVVKHGAPTLDDADDLLKRLLRLVQIASNPRLVDEAYAGVPGKLDALMPLLDNALRPDATAKVIVWTSFTANADWLTKQLAEYGAVRLHGKMSIDDRNRAIRRFKTATDARVLVATPGAAKEGLTLTVANHAVFFDRSFSLDDYLQAQDRIHRISQQRQCYIYNLVMRGTVDEWVDDLLGAKHLAAQLGVGDIDGVEYSARANYTFSETLERILGRSPGGHTA
jgi:SNF2 family DNA or RNA helicase